MALDVEVPLGQNLETCVNPRARWYMAEGRFVARSVSRSQHLKQRSSKQASHTQRAGSPFQLADLGSSHSMLFQ